MLEKVLSFYTMTSKIFIIRITISFLVFFTSFVSYNWYQDEFGLFGRRNSIRILSGEKSSKYLLSFRYIPENFNGILIGPSVSAHLDTRQISEHKVYNLSMNGANITELKYAADNVLKSGEIDFIIICLYYYSTMNSGMKDTQIRPMVYWESLFSEVAIHMLKARLVHTLKPNAPGPLTESEYGWYNYNFDLSKKIDLKKIVEKYLVSGRKEIPIDPVAVQDLQSIVNLAHEKNIQVFAFYYPLYHPFRKPFIENQSWENYQKAMNGVFRDDDIVWDMNIPQYDFFTKDASNYSDGHLSIKGADLLVEDINKKISENLKLD